MFNRLLLCIFRNWKGLRTSGRVTINADPSAKVILGSAGESYLGVPIMGPLSRPESSTILLLQADSQIELNRVSIGRGSRIVVRPGARLSIGEGTYLTEDCYVSSGVDIRIGSRCAISWEVQIFDEDGHELEGKSDRGAIEIGDNVWIGTRATILKGSRIGSGSVVASGAVVSGDFPARSLIGGVPAKVIRQNVSWNFEPSNQGRKSGAQLG